AERAAARLQVRRPLPVRGRALPRRGAGAGAARRIVGALPLSARGPGERGRAMTAPAEPIAAADAAADALVSVRGLSKHFPIKVAWPRRPASPALQLWRAISRMPAMVRA